MKINNNPIWQKLLEHKQRLASIRLNNLFFEDPQRFKNFSREACDVLYDFSKQHIDAAALQDLIELANACELKQHIADLFAGKNVNKTENRPALHMRLRDPQPTPEIQAVRQRLSTFVAAMHSQEFVSVSGKPIKHVISLGIGGSDLGPLMVCEALKHFRVSDLAMHFVSNVDGETLSTLLAEISPEETICLVNSKTFTTPETLLNAKTVKAWFEQRLGAGAVPKQMFAVTANEAKAKEFGIAAANIFTFWDWVGGRYSVWSAVGLPIELMLGTKQFQEFLTGAHVMDEHFLHSDFAHNLPVLMGLIGIWNINFFNYSSLLIMPYLDSLRNFPAYLQQLEMESNGKAAVDTGGYADYMTAPVLWGGVGCNGQHAYMQLLHQGPAVVPIDFIVAVNSHAKLQAQQDFLLASCLSQSKALMSGLAEWDLLRQNNPQQLAEAKMCPGNRPSNTIMFASLTPRMLGSLIAWYEHKVFVQGVIWQIQSFDQWGVELGKKITKDVLPLVQQCGLQYSQHSQHSMMQQPFEQQQIEQQPMGQQPMAQQFHAHAQPLYEQQRHTAAQLDGSTAGLLEYIQRKKG